MTYHRAMAVRTDNSNKTLLIFKQAYAWTNSVYLHAQHRLDIWSSKRRMARNSKMLESLPDHILKDIGWPFINEDVRGPQ